MAVSHCVLRPLLKMGCGTVDGVTKLWQHLRSEFEIAIGELPLLTECGTARHETHLQIIKKKTSIVFENFSVTSLAIVVFRQGKKYYSLKLKLKKKIQFQRLTIVNQNHEKQISRIDHCCKYISLHYFELRCYF